MSDLRKLLASLNEINEQTNKVNDPLKLTPPGGSEPSDQGPLKTAAQNIKASTAAIAQIPQNIKKFATDPAEYIKNLPAPSPEQIAMGFAGGGVKGAVPKLPAKVPGQAPKVWRNPRTGEVSATPPVTTATPLPPGVTPSTAGAGRGTGGISQGIGQATAKPKITVQPGETPAQAVARAQAEIAAKPAAAPKAAPKPAAAKDVSGRTEPKLDTTDAATLPAWARERPISVTEPGPTNIKKSTAASLAAHAAALGLGVLSNKKPEAGGAEPANATGNQSNRPDAQAATDTSGEIKVNSPAVGSQGETSPRYVVKLQPPDDSTSQTSQTSQTPTPSKEQPVSTTTTKQTGTSQGTGTGSGTGSGEGDEADWFTRLQKMSPGTFTKEGTNSSMRDILEKMDSMTSAEKKPTGPKFPGYWKGKDSADKSRSRMVGSAEESIIPALNKIAENKSLEWKLTEALKQFKEQDPATYTGVDPIVRQRMGMPAATQDEIRTYVDKNPPVVTTSTGQPVRSGSGQPVTAAGLSNVAKAADTASPDRAQAVAKMPTSQPATIPSAAQPATMPSATSVTQAAVQGAETQPIRQPVITPEPLPPISPAPAAPAVATKPVATTPKMPEKIEPGSWQDVWKSNPDIKNPNLIYPGQEIKLPGSSEKYIVQKGDSLSKIAGMVRKGDIGGSTTDPNAPVKPRTATTAQPAAATAPAQSFAKSYKSQPTNKVDLSVNNPAMNPAAQPSGLEPRFQAAAIKRVNDLKKSGKLDVADKVSKNLIKQGVVTADQLKETETDKKIAGRYHPDEFDDMVLRVKKLAQQQDKKHGPVDIARLAKRLRDLERKEQTKEQEDPTVNKQDPDAQTTSQTSPQQDPAAVKQQQIDQQQDVSVAKGTMSGLKSVLGTGVDTNALSSAVTKISDQQPLTAPEATAMSALTPLIAKAAETPQSAPALKTALSNAALLAKQGK